MATLARLFPRKNPKSVVPISGIFSPPSHLSSTLSPSSRTPLKSILQDLFEERDLQTLVEKFKSSSQSYRFRCKHRIYSVTVQRLASANRPDSVAEIIEHHKQYPEISSEGFAVRLISLYGQARMFDHARSLFDDLPQLKCTRTTKSFNALLTAAHDSKLFSKVAELFDALPGEISVKPDVFSYSIMIQAFCKMGSLDSALSTLEKMEKNGLRPNSIIFNILLNGLYQGNRFLDAERIWEKMAEYDCAPDTYSYNAKLRGLVLEGKTEEAVNLVNELENRGVKPDVHSFNALIKGHCNNGNLEEAKKVFNDLEKNDCSPNRQTFETLIPIVCEKGNLDWALALCKDGINRRCPASVEIVQGVVDALVKESRMDDAEKLIEFGASRNYASRSGLKLPSGNE